MTSINVTGQQVIAIPPDPMVRTRYQQARAAYKGWVRRDPVPIRPDLRVRNGPAAYQERYTDRPALFRLEQLHTLHGTLAGWSPLCWSMHAETTTWSGLLSLRPLCCTDDICNIYFITDTYAGLRWFCGPLVHSKVWLVSCFSVFLLQAASTY